ncbi:MAG TPA: hypothetical protein VFC51_12855 [Chloroflexota bacterium]|nr:hypothetical protein [Chloroflexota bacterium]
MRRETDIDTVCETCGGASVVTEPELDRDEIPTGVLIVRCDGCGRELGRLTEQEYAPEAEPPVEGEILIPSEDEMPRSA